MLKANNITKFYGEGGYRTPALRGVSLKILDGAFIAVMGPSGSGKSTLLNMLGSLDRPTEGEVIPDDIRIDNLGEDELVAIRRERIAYVFQQYHLLPSLTAIENVILPLTFSGKIDGAEERGLELLKRFGLEGRAQHRPDQLSGGEKQRVAIARAIIGGASVILADEPTVDNPGEVTPSRTPTVTDEPIKARWIEATANGDQVSIPVSEVQENRNIHFKVSSEKRVMNFMAYEVGDEIFVRGNVCPPCRSKGFSLQNDILVCDSCATTFEALTGDGVAGACVDYPKETVPHMIEGKNIVMEINDLTRSYEKTLERG